MLHGGRNNFYQAPSTQGIENRRNIDAFLCFPTQVYFIESLLLYRNSWKAQCKRALFIEKSFLPLAKGSLFFCCLHFLLFLSFSLLMNFLSFYMDMTQHGRHSKSSIIFYDKFLGKDCGLTLSSSIWPGGKRGGPNNQSLPLGLTDRFHIKRMASYFF